MRFLIQFYLVLIPGALIFLTLPVRAATPIIASVTDTNGKAISSAIPGAVIQVHGSGFGGTQGSNYVCFCTSATGGYLSSGDYFVVNSWSDTAISLTIPPSNIVPFGSYALTVFLWDGKIADPVSAQSNGLPFAIASPGPTISYLSGGAQQVAPNVYGAVQGAEIIIYGTGLSDFGGCTPAGTVLLEQPGVGGLSTRNYRAVNLPLQGLQEIVVGLTGNLAPGPYKFVLTDGSGRQSNIVQVSVSAISGAGTPIENGAQITSIDPNPAWLSPTIELNVYGGGFGTSQGSGSVVFSNISGSRPSINLTQNLGWSNGQISFEPPSSLIPGVYRVTVTGLCGKTSEPFSLAIKAVPPVWGFADLHAHPASNFAFGGDANGQNGIFWGSFGGSFAKYGNIQSGIEEFPTSPPGFIQVQLPPYTYTYDPAIAADLPDCNGMHSGFTLNPVQHATHANIIARIDAEPVCTASGCTGGNPDSGGLLGLYLGYGGHGSQGFPSFTSWPTASSIEHQQMHVTAIHRAYEGGLRVLIASVTDDQFLSYAWTTSGLGPEYPACGGSGCLDPTFDFNSAVKQLTAISNFVTENSSWMQIVKTPAEARQAISQNKLAVILSLEMDELTVDQIVTLVNVYGVRHIIPIHLVNNSFGGTAMYSDDFNSENKFLNGSFYQAAGQPDQCLTFRSQSLETLSAGSFGIQTNTLSSSDFSQLGYPFPPGQFSLTGPGERNALGLTNPAQLLQLMYSHVLLDIAHMGETSSQETIALASAHNNYPLMYSHGGLRDDSPNCAPQADGPLGKASDITERSLGISQAQQLAALSGMIGLGTSGLTHNSSPVDQWLSAYRQALQLMASANGGLPRGVTFGTDMNGLSPQIAFDTQPTTYPITVASTTSPPPGVATPGLPAFAKMGNQNVLYDFQKDGIANYGMLPDFIQALSQRPNAFPVIKALYSTAEDVIETWEAAENVLVINPSSSVEPAFLNVLFGTAIPLPGPVTTTASTAYTATGYIGKQYTETLSVSGGVPPYTWQQNTQYPMPPGLSFNSNGTITGTPTTIGTYTVTVSALDSASPSAVASQWFTIKIQAAP